MARRQTIHDSPSDTRRPYRVPGCVRLLDLPIGRKARLCGDHGHSAAPSRFADLGFIPGTLVRIIRRAPLGDPLEIEIRGTRVCARVEELRALHAIPEKLS